MDCTRRLGCRKSSVRGRVTLYESSSGRWRLPLPLCKTAVDTQYMRSPICPPVQGGEAMESMSVSLRSVLRIKERP
jgi:hypothetical protein